MPPKADKLSQTLENFQLFLRRRFEDREDFKEISRNLSKLQISLKQKKLSVQIVSDRASLAQGLYDLIETNEQLKEVYQLKFDPLPEIPQQQKQQQFASLKLKQTKDNDTDLQQYYQLNENRSISLGRSAEGDITLDGTLYRFVPTLTDSDRAEKSNFLLSFAGTSCETIYKQKSLLGYIAKELRSNLMAIMMPIMLLIPLIVAETTVSKGKIFGTVAKIFNQYLGFLVLLSV
jgi:hypothetical protein